MEFKRPKLYGCRSKIRPSNSEFDFDDALESDKPPAAPVPSLFWSDRYKKQEAHNFCIGDNRKRKLPLKDNMNKLPKINHLDEICNRAARGKFMNKSKGKFGTKSIGRSAAFDFDGDRDESPDMSRVSLSHAIPSKRPLKAESPSKHRKLVSSSFDFPTEEKEQAVKEKIDRIMKPGPKKKKLNMKALQPSKSNGRLGNLFDLPDENDGEENLVPIDFIEIEPCDNPDQEQTMISNVKDSGNCIKAGEDQRFFDEFDYLFDGMRKTEPMAVRCLSTFNVTKNCFKKEFRDSIRKNNLLKTLFKELSDADTDSSLALCTAAFLYVISIDDKHFDFSKPAIEILLKTLKAEEENIRKTNVFGQTVKKPTKSLTNFRKKFSDLFRQELKSADFIDLDNIATADLVHEVLIFLTAPTAEVDFREFIRTMGGIDFFILSFEHLVSRLDKYHRATNENCARFAKIERCLQMLENLTYMNTDNQNYSLNFQTKGIVKCLHGTLCNALTTIHKSKSAKIKLLAKSKNLDTIFDCVFATMRMMLNLTHGNEYSCTEVGKYKGMIEVILENILFLPGICQVKHKLDCYTLGLGLLINLLGEVPQNRILLAKCRFDSSPWFDAVEDSIEERSKSPVELIIQTFLRFHNSSNELEKQTFSEAESLCMQEGEAGDQPIEVDLEIEEPGLEKRASNSAKAAQSEDKGKEEDDPFGYTETDPATEVKPKEQPKAANNTEKVKKVVDNMIEKAGEHMEESMIGSYLALLIGILTKEEDHLEVVKKLMPEPKILIEVLRKFLQFMNMMSLTSAAASKSGMQQIRTIVHWLSAVL